MVLKAHFPIHSGSLATSCLSRSEFAQRKSRLISELSIGSSHNITRPNPGCSHFYVVAHIRASQTLMSLKPPRVWFSRSGVSPRLWILNKLPGDMRLLVHVSHMVVRDWMFLVSFLYKYVQGNRACVCLPEASALCVLTLPSLHCPHLKADEN